MPRLSYAVLCRNRSARQRASIQSRAGRRGEIDVDCAKSGMVQEWGGEEEEEAKAKAREKGGREGRGRVTLTNGSMRVSPDGGRKGRERESAGKGRGVHCQRGAADRVNRGVKKGRDWIRWSQPEKKTGARRADGKWLFWSGTLSTLARRHAGATPSRSHSCCETIDCQFSSPSFPLC